MADNDSGAAPSLFHRFPALLQLGRTSGARNITYVPQLTQSECGMACLAMVLGYYGKPVRIEELRQLHASARSGMTPRFDGTVSALFHRRRLAARAERRIHPGRRVGEANLVVRQAASWPRGIVVEDRHHLLASAALLAGGAGAHRSDRRPHRPAVGLPPAARYRRRLALPRRLSVPL